MSGSNPTVDQPLVNTLLDGFLSPPASLLLVPVAWLISADGGVSLLCAMFGLHTMAGLKYGAEKACFSLIVCFRSKTLPSVSSVLC